jgi:prepilin-type N-terminal cleavage/methylation domain-containing protein
MMLGQASRDQRGFTIVEMMIALSVFFLVLGGLFQLFGPSNVMYAAGHRKLDVQQSARVAMDTIVRQMRMAGYFPENFDANPGNDQANPIHIATDTALTVYGDTDGSGASQVYTFCLDAGGLRRLRENLAGATYQCANGEVLADNVTNLRFAYYDRDGIPVPDPPASPYALDGQGAGIVPGFANTAQRGAIRTVVITLTAQQDVPGQSTQVYTLSSDVRLRNLD